MDNGKTSWWASHRPSKRRLVQLYCALLYNAHVKGFVEGEIYETDARTAEMCKLSENTFRDVNIAFANELAKICEDQGINVWELIEICNKHPRVNIHQPGPGVGGHCISVDPWFLVGDYPSLAKVIDEAMKTNDSQPSFVLERIHETMQAAGISDPSRVGLYGLTYKEDVDDCRESPTLQLLQAQERHLGVPLKVYDPYVGRAPADRRGAGETRRQDGPGLPPCPFPARRPSIVKACYEEDPARIRHAPRGHQDGSARRGVPRPPRGL